MSSKSITAATLKKFSPTEIQQSLIGVTIGGIKKKVDLKQKALVFAEYVSRAFPDAQVLEVKPIDTTAALNSVSGIITLKFDGKLIQKVFGKVHVESNTQCVDPLGAEREYENAEMLANAGWPVIEPIKKSAQTDYPLLLYPVINAPALFDQLEESYKAGKILIAKNSLKLLKKHNSIIGQKEVASMRLGTRQEAINAPVQTLLLKRFKHGERIDQWYQSDTIFRLPGLTKGITWNDLLDKKWNINDQDYSLTLRKIIEESRKTLSFAGEVQAFMTVSHGDDHPGNVLLTNPPVAFDPAFAGWNPATLDLKALAHTGFLPIVAMYYPIKDLKIEYKTSKEKIYVTTNIKLLTMYKTHEDLAKQIIDTRILPLLKRIKEMGGNIENEKKRIQSGLIGCALLTVNIAQLLEQKDGRAIGLLPMVLMFAELKGLSMLDYLNNEINKL